MNENNNLNVNEEELKNNNKTEMNNKSNNKIIYIFIGILVLAIIGCILVVINNKDDKKDKTNEPEQNTTIEDEKDEENINNNLPTDAKEDDITVKDETDNEEESEENEDVIENIHAGDKYEKYYYLIDRLIFPSNTTIFDTNFDIKNINNDFMLLVAISSLVEENVTDKMDLINHECYTKNEEYRYVEGYKSSRVIEKVKDIFGKNIKINITKDKAIGNIYTYVKDTDGYVNINDTGGCGTGYYGSMLNFVIESVEDTKTHLVIIGNAYFYDFREGQLLNVNSEEVIKKYEVGMTSELELQQYVRQNKDKFSQYKFTFTLEDGNYIFTGLEKLK